MNTVGDVSIEKVRELAEVALEWFPAVKLLAVTRVDVQPGGAAIVVRFDSSMVVLPVDEKQTDLSLVATLRGVLMRDR